MKARIMAHMVAHYPNAQASLSVGKALLDAGVAYVEVQFPFSDPTADGPTIQSACTEALASGFRVHEGFRLVSELCRYRDEQGLDARVVIMSYASLVYAPGVAWFCERSSEAGAFGLIVPDLPLDSDEGLFAEGAAHGVEIIPVIVPSMSADRRTLLAERSPNYVYAALRSGITGTYTQIGQENVAFLDSLKPLHAQVLAGFGIREKAQVDALMPHVHAVVVGSAIVSVIAQSGPAETSDAVFRLVSSLVE